jgi:hypothetical protein
MKGLSVTLAAALMLGSCAAETTPATPTESSPSATTRADSTVEPAPTQSTSPPPTMAAEPTEPVQSAPPASATGPSRAAELGLMDIELLTPTEGGGRRPALEWAAVPDAAHYHVFVRAPSGRVYWAWRTSDTSVPVGGVPQLVDGAAGPSISNGMTWSVSAVDAEGKVIGLSGHRPIAP